jgi:Fe2+ or Zn2+ uptake regulation protein
MGRSAIYRTLHWLESHGKMRRVDTASGKNVFVRGDAKVLCLVECPVCGALRQMADEELSLHTGELAARAGFALVNAIWVLSMPCRKHERAKPT